MVPNKKYDRIFAFVSWLIVVALIFSAIMLWVLPPSGAGPVSSLVGVAGAQVFYSTLYLGESSALFYAKFLKKNRMRKIVLLVIYLTGFFTSLLTLGLAGWVPGVLDNLIIATAAAACWLYWTFKTEYVTKEQFKAYHDKQG